MSAGRRPPTRRTLAVASGPAGARTTTKGVPAPAKEAPPAPARGMPVSTCEGTHGSLSMDEYTQDLAWPDGPSLAWPDGPCIVCECYLQCLCLGGVAVDMVVGAHGAAPTAAANPAGTSGCAGVANGVTHAAGGVPRPHRTVVAANTWLAATASTGLCAHDGASSDDDLIAHRCSGCRTGIR